MVDGRWTKRRPNPARCRLIADFLDTGRQLLTDYLMIDPYWKGLEGSQLAREKDGIEEKQGREFRDEVQAVVNSASLVLFATIQHVESVAVLLRADVPPIYSLNAVARAAMELGANTWRLTDPTIGARERVIRLSLDRLHSARELETMLRETGLPAKDFAGLSSLEETRAHIASLGLNVVLGKRPSGDKVDGHKRPSTTETMESFAGRGIETDSRRVYRLASAVTHGTLWGLTIFFSTKEAEDGRLSTEFAVEQSWIDGVSLAAAEGFAWALENFVLYLGWDPEPLRRWMMGVDELFG